MAERAERTEVNVGVLVMHAPNGDLPALRRFADRVVADAGPVLESASGARWRFDPVDPARLPNDEARRPADFLDEASLRMVEGPYDLVLVVTDVGLVSRDHAVVAGAPSRVSRTAVLSTRKLLVTRRKEATRTLDAESVHWNAVALLLHLIGHILDLPSARGDGDVMTPFRFDPARRAPPRFSARDRARLARRIQGAPQDEWVEPGRTLSLLVHAASGVRHAPLVARALWRNRAPLLPLVLPRLATAAIVPGFILVFTAEIWDVGLNLPDRVAWGFALVSILVATAYLVRAQNLFFPRKERRVLTEYMAVVNVTVFLTILLAVVGLFVLVLVVMIAIVLYVFPPGLIATWPTLGAPAVGLVDKIRLAAFISTIGVLTGGLGGGLESRALIRHLALFEERP